MADREEPTDLLALMRAIYLSREQFLHEGIHVEQIALIEAAWEISDTVVSSHGWVLSMTGGSRVYLEYTLDGTKSGASEEIELRDLKPDEAFPTLDSNAGVFWYRPDHINRHLGITPPSLH
jgi:hypothetical protein